MYPDFLGIGAQKAGSTWIDRNLECHPGIWMPPRKEIHYFDRSLDWRDPPNKKNRSFQDPTFKQYSLRGVRETLWLRKFRKTPRSDAWYLSLFKPRGNQICGEITPDYSALDEDAVARAYGLVPDAKIIFIMRNPIERTWSHAQMDFLRAKRNAEKSTVEDLREFAQRGYVHRRCDYLKTLEVWSSFYPTERIFVGFLEDIENHPRRFLRELYGFLGVDASFKPPTPKKRLNSRSNGSMPSGVARMLAGLYREDLARLRGFFGGYATFWAHCSERLMSDVSWEERITVPMGKSGLWDEWEGRKELEKNPDLQSAPLSEFDGWNQRNPLADVSDC